MDVIVLQTPHPNRAYQPKPCSSCGPCGIFESNQARPDPSLLDTRLHPGSIHLQTPPNTLHPVRRATPCTWRQLSALWCLGSTAIDSMAAAPSNHTHASLTHDACTAMAAAAVAAAAVEQQEQAPKRRPQCAGCGRPLRVCYCAALPAQPLQLRGRVVILQHPHELK